MIIAFLMGFSCGLPLLLTLSLLQAWMHEAQVDLATIGAFSLVGLPYTIKFLWAPLADRFNIFGLGRRRGWLLLIQILLVLSILAMAATDPSGGPWIMATIALGLAFFSASQDIVVDAYRRETLADEELGLGSSFYVNGYRLGMLMASGGGLVLADFLSFSTVYLIMATGMIVGIVTTIFVPEPDVEHIPTSLRDAVILPLKDYFSRRNALFILVFILIFKLGDTMAFTMSTPFYLDLQFSKTEIGVATQLVGFWAILVGGTFAGVLILKLQLYRSLWIFGILQMVSTAGFVLLAIVGHDVGWLSAVVAFENLCTGMANAAFLGYMASITNKSFTATQYALLSSLIGIPRVLASSATGLMAEYFGWVGFFTLCTLIAIPGLVMLRRIAPWNGVSSVYRSTTDGS